MEVAEAATVQDYMAVGLGAEALSEGMTAGHKIPWDADDDDDGSSADPDADGGADEVAAMADEVARAIDAPEGADAEAPADDEADDPSVHPDGPTAEAEDEPADEAASTDIGPNPPASASRWTRFEYAPDDADDPAAGGQDSDDER